ncbi:PAS domain S-box protein [Microcoleus sp. FACHB-68]|uniref:PAS domain S-box protein n=1 Tax=Microcoleus sp. FACHB-68 TaxID=2692826 RepID=UPI001688352D|nr:PAS domain S-box protein [Microcoleus sp. FACHB-68]MBD1936032.1 PAS domain S-box protein [Microcoleus sp. FACHB-68]
MPCFEEINNRLKLALQANHTAIWEWNLPSYSLAWSENLEPLFGLPAGTRLSSYEAVLEKVHPEDQSVLSKLFTPAGIACEDFYIEFRIIWPDGSVRWIAGTGKVFKDEDGKPAQMMGMCVDITQKKQAEAALQEEQNLLAAVLDTTDALVVVLDRQGRIVHCNRAGFATIGYSLAEVRGQFFWQIFLTPEALPNGLECSNFERQFPKQHDSECMTRDGTRRLITWSHRSLQDANNSFKYRIATGIDITESAKVEAASTGEIGFLSNRDREFRATFEQAGIGIAHLALDGRFVRVNQRFCDILNYTAEEFESLRVQDITHPEDLDADCVDISQLLQKQIFSYCIEKRYRHKEGFYVWGNLTVSLVRDASGSPQYAISILEDITERKQGEETIRKREIEMQSMVSLLAEAQKVAHVGWWEFDVGTQAVNWSDELFRIVGLEPSQPPPNFSEYLRMVHPDDIKVVTKAVKQVVNEAQSYEFDQRIVRPDGEVRYLAAKGQPIFDNEGNVIKLLGTVLDITERKLAEETLRESEGELVRKATELEQTLNALQLTQAQLIQTEKMSSLGQLVAGVAHEINNPINFIYGNLTFAIQYSQDLLGLIQLYQQGYHTEKPEGKKDAVHEYIEAIDLDYLKEDLPRLLRSMQLGAERIRSIVLSLRNFSRLDESQMKVVDIHEGIESTLLILQHRLKEKSGRYMIQIIKEFGDLPAVECYPALLNQVFMNLIGNAIDALESLVGVPLPAESEREGLMNEKLTKVIKIRTEYNPEPSRLNLEVFQNSKFEIKNHVVIHIADNGPGISSRIQTKIFDPFFTTKPVGKGTGLGLSICYQIMEKHGGQIWVKSQPAQGTEFVLILPVQQVPVS